MKVRNFSFWNKDFLHNPIIQWVFIASIFVNLAAWLFLAIFIRPVDYPIILHYNAYFGVDFIGIWWQSYFLPVIGTFILFLNFFLAKIIFVKKERIAAYVLLLAAFVVQIGIFIAAASVILINY